MRVTIEKPNGEKLVISGTPEEVAALLKAREEQPARPPVFVPHFTTPWWDSTRPHSTQPHITWSPSTCGELFTIEVAESRVGWQ